MSDTWPSPIRLAELNRGERRYHLEPDAEERGRIAKQLGLQALQRFSADLLVKPWLDGAEISGRFEAMVEQVCGVSLEPFEAVLRGDIDVRVVPAGSPNTPQESIGEVVLEPDAPDPPDVLENESIDLTGYLVEHLGLEVDPFPRKPGAVFDYAPEKTEESPFAALRALKANDD